MYLYLKRVRVADSRVWVVVAVRWMPWSGVAWAVVSGVWAVVVVAVVSCLGWSGPVSRMWEIYHVGDRAVAVWPQPVGHECGPLGLVFTVYV